MHVTKILSMGLLYYTRHDNMITVVESYNTVSFIVCISNEIFKLKPVINTYCVKIS